MRARVQGLSVIGPGLPDWRTARAVLRGEEDWVSADPVFDVPSILSARERRRTTPSMRLALNTAMAACADAGLSQDVPASVFVSALGDGAVVDSMLRALCTEEKLVSPTMFHNSVHNAAAGYWGIGTKCHAPTTSLAAGDGSFGAGLLKALLQVTSETRPVLLVVSDAPLPEPLSASRAIGAAFGVGMVLVPDADGAEAAPLLSVAFGEAAVAGEGDHDAHALLPLVSAAPAGRALPLLHLLARGQGGTLTVDVGEAGGMALSVQVTA